jgi:hypothetical protein
MRVLHRHPILALCGVTTCALLLAGLVHCDPSGSGGAGGGGQSAGGTAGTAGAGAGGTAGSGGSGGVAGVDGGSGGSAGSSPDGGAGGPAAGVTWTGRVDARDPNAAVFAWQGAGLRATVNGTSIGVRLRTDDTASAFFQARIDGNLGPRFEVREGGVRTVSLASGLAPGDHAIELYRETEGAYGRSTFLGFASGTLEAPPPSNGRLIEVVGDSISAGYGNLGEEIHPAPDWVAAPACHWTAENSSWYLTYAAIAGRELNAEVSTIARSGWGMVRDRGNDATHVLSAVYDNAVGTGATPPWSFNRPASAVVINLGTNDWNGGDPGVSYETAYAQFIAHLRTRYPSAWILLTIGPMTGEPALTQIKTRLANVVAARTGQGDSKVATFDFGQQNLGADGRIPTGCDWHPSRAEHQRMAQILKAQLQSKLGW